MLIKTSAGRRRQIELKLRMLELTAAYAGDIDLTERSTRPGKPARKLRGDVTLSRRIKQLKALVPQGEISVECWRMLDGLLIVTEELVDAAMSDEVRRDVAFLSDLMDMCAGAAANDFKLPADVAEHCEPRKLKPKKGTIGGTRGVGGAALLAWGYYVPEPGTPESKARENAGKRAESAIERARRHGVEFDGLGRG